MDTLEWNYATSGSIIILIVNWLEYYFNLQSRPYTNADAYNKSR